MVTWLGGFCWLIMANTMFNTEEHDMIIFDQVLVNGWLIMAQALTRPAKRYGAVGNLYIFLGGQGNNCRGNGIHLTRKP